MPAGFKHWYKTFGCFAPIVLNLPCNPCSKKQPVYQRNGLRCIHIFFYFKIEIQSTLKHEIPRKFRI